MEVNALLHAFHDDHANLRRYLVDQGFLTRDGGAHARRPKRAILTLGPECAFAVSEW